MVDIGAVTAVLALLFTILLVYESVKLYRQINSFWINLVHGTFTVVMVTATLFINYIEFIYPK